MLKEKVMSIHILIVMVILALIYMIGLSTVTFLMFLELSSEEDKPQLIVINVENINPQEIKKNPPKPEVKSQEITKPKVIPPVKKEIPKVAPQSTKPKTKGNAYLLAQIIHAEANDEPYNGKLAVGNVVMNRVKSDTFPDTLKEVIFQKGQFQPVTNGSIYNKPSSDALKAANEVLNGRNIVGNQALYFYNPKTSTSDWIFSRKTIMDIGNHRFAY